MPPLPAAARANAAAEWRSRLRTTLPVGVAAMLLLLGLANIVQRATSDDVEDGVLWVQRTTGVVAAEVDPVSPAARAGVRAGDVLLAVDGQAIEARDDVHALQQAASRGTRHTYTLLTLGDRRVTQVTLAPIPRGVGSLYYVLAAVGIFSLLVGATVRTRRPSDEATLHFFWLAVAFFGVFTFSFSGRLDRVDWVFYWADQIATLLLPPLFVHFGAGLPRAAALGRPGRRCPPRLAPLLYVPPIAARCAPGRGAGARLRGSGPVDRHHRLARPIRAALHRRLHDRRARALRPGPAPRPVDDRAAPAALDRLGHGHRRRAVHRSPTPSRSPSAPRPR